MWQIGIKVKVIKKKKKSKGKSKCFADFINFNTPEDVQLKRCLAHKEIWMKIANSNAYCYPTVSDVLQDLPKEKNYDILTTGSLHLVGALLSILDPSLSGNL